MLRLVHDYVREALTALGFRNGAGHSELILTSRSPVLIDPGARLGGGVLPWVSERLAGHSHAGLLAASIVAPEALAAVAGELPLRFEHAVRYVSLINHAAGRMATLDWVDRLSALPTSIAVATGVTAGSYLPRTTDLLTSPGFAYLGGESRAAVEADYRSIRKWERDLLYTGGRGVKATSGAVRAPSRRELVAAEAKT